MTGPWRKGGALFLLLVSVAAARAAEPPAKPPAANDYPTSARADYVLGCMAANGNTHESLFKCSCAIDAVAGQMPYADYEEAETALSMQRGGGLGGRVGGGPGRSDVTLVRQRDAPVREASRPPDLIVSCLGLSGDLAELCGGSSQITLE